MLSTVSCQLLVWPMFTWVRVSKIRTARQSYYVLQSKNHQQTSVFLLPWVLWAPVCFCQRGFSLLRKVGHSCLTTSITLPDNLRWPCRGSQKFSTHAVILSPWDKGKAKKRLGRSSQIVLRGCWWQWRAVTCYVLLRARVSLAFTVPWWGTIHRRRNCAHSR